MKMYRKVLVVIGVMLMMGMNRKTEARVWIVPKFEGRVIDSVTGKPVENVIVTGEWSGSGIKLSPSIIGERSEMSTSSEVIITGKDGKFIFHSKMNLPIIDSFTNFAIRTEHPLYVRNGEIIYTIDDVSGKETSCMGEKQSDGTIHYDIRLVGLEEAMAKAITDEKIELQKNPKYISRNRPSAIGGWTASYFKELKEKYGVRYDLNNVWNKWVELTQKYYGINLYEVMKFNNDTKKIKEDMDKLLQEGY